MDLSSVCDNKQDCKVSLQFCLIPRYLHPLLTCSLMLYLTLQDGSDEDSCPCDHDKQWTCSDGTCIDVSRRCDGTRDCDSGGDEEDCPRCTGDDFQCSDYSCISVNMVCNGVQDCVQGEDEDTCPTQPPVTCTADQLTCPEGGCATRCDQKHECFDGSDEHNCCFADKKQFKCSDDECIASGLECDGKKDCSNGSDEHSGCGKWMKISYFV